MFQSLDRIPGLARIRQHEAVHHLTLAVRSVLAELHGGSKSAGESVAEGTAARGAESVASSAAEPVAESALMRAAEPAPEPAVAPVAETVIRSWESVEFQDAVGPVAGLTELTAEALFLLQQLAQAATAVPGDFAELGPGRGGTAWLLASVLDKLAPSKRLALLDPSSDPIAASPLAQAQELLKDFPKVFIHPGPLSERRAELANRSFAFVHVNCADYQAVQESCELFYPRMAPGGFLVFANYGSVSAPGTAQAVDEFLQSRPERLIRLTSAQAVICILPRKETPKRKSK